MDDLEPRESNLRSAVRAWTRFKSDHPPGMSEASDALIALADDVITEYGAVLFSVQDWAVANEIAAPPLDWKLLGEILNG